MRSNKVITKSLQHDVTEQGIGEIYLPAREVDSAGRCEDQTSYIALSVRGLLKARKLYSRLNLKAISEENKIIVFPREGKSISKKEMEIYMKVLFSDIAPVNWDVIVFRFISRKKYEIVSLDSQKMPVTRIVDILNRSLERNSDYGSYLEVRKESLTKMNKKYVIGVKKGKHLAPGEILIDSINTFFYPYGFRLIDQPPYQPKKSLLAPTTSGCNPYLSDSYQTLIGFFPRAVCNNQEAIAERSERDDANFKCGLQ